MKRKNFGDLLVEGLQEAVGHARGELDARVVAVDVTARHAEAAPPPRYSPARVKAVRERMRLSQSLFAGVLNVSDATVRAWERGARAPEGPTLRLLEIAEKHPEVLVSTISPRDVRRPTPRTQPG